MPRSRFLLSLLFLSLFLTSLAGAFIPEKNLAPRFRHWLDDEASYIIQSDERTEFLSLKSDAERDAFIQQFWEARNPTPGAPTNPYKEEHFRRIAYANEHFGDPKNANGWRTDQGRIYITLGEPQSIVTYPNARNVRPMIAWFYKSPTPALPSFFYVLFYKRSIGESYTIYSPYQDGPSRLTTGLEDLNVQSRSLQTIRKSLGDEVARMTISLIPSEPVDLNNYSPSMSSDVMLATIRNLPDNDLQKQQVALNRNREKVTPSILSNNDQPSVGYSVTRDDKGQSIVNYLIGFQEPDPSLIGTRHDKTLGYDLTLRNHITTEAGKLVYDQIDVISSEVKPGQAEVGRKKPFAAEDRFALVPGTYVVESTLTNNLNLVAHRVTEKVVVPEPRPAVLGISEPVVFSGGTSSDPNGELPFSFSKLRFSPRAVHTVTIHSGDRVPCVFQLWLPKEANGAVRKDQVQIHYLYGSSALNEKPIDETDETVETTNADAAGNLVTGHTFQTVDLPVGSYRVVIRATQQGSAPAYATMTLHVVPPDVAVGDWSAYGPTQVSQDQQKRTLAADAQQGVPENKAAAAVKR